MNTEKTQGIPQELKKYDQWCVYIEKRGKMPVNPHTLKNAAVNKPVTFSTYLRAIEEVQKNNAQGIGFVFTKDDPYVSIDIDDCIDNSGCLSQKAEQYVTLLNTYTEISISGKGLHIIGSVNDLSFMRAVKEKGFEFYPFNRFIILTGNIYKDYSRINDVSEIFVKQFKKLDKYNYNPFTEEQPQYIPEDQKHQEGNRNNGLFNYAVLLRKTGLSEKILFESCKIYNTSYCVPPLKGREVTQIVKSVLRYPIDQLLPAKMARIRAEEKEIEEKEAHWTDEHGYIRNKNNKIKQGAHNTLLLLKNNSTSWKIQYDEFKDRIYVNDDELDETIQNDVVCWIEATTTMCPWPKATTYDCICNIAFDHVVNPLKTYLKSLKWDNVERIRYMAEDIFHIENTEYHQSVFETFFVQAINRAMNPGCQADGVLLLISKQGNYKSTFCKKIVPQEDWYLNYSLTNVHDKDGSAALCGKWIVEMSELSGLARSTIESVKAYFSRTTDEYRPPYGRYIVRKPRTAVIVGTTNDEVPLKDTTGNRRYWPIYFTEKIDIKIVIENRDQYWAEALHQYRKGINTWYEDENTLEQQERATETEAFTDFLIEALERIPPNTELTLPRICEALALKPNDVNKSIQTRIGIAMRKLGFSVSKKFGRDENSNVVKQTIWYKSGKNMV